MLFVIMKIPMIPNSLHTASSISMSLFIEFFFQNFGALGRARHKIDVGQ
jgi:hypothetical protein